MKVGVVLAVLVASALYWVPIFFFGNDFKELDVTSKILVSVYQGILPAFIDSAMEFSDLEGVKKKRSALRSLSVACNAAESLFDQTLLNVNVHDVKVSHGDVDVPIRVYTPKYNNASEQQRKPVMLWVHGGGCVSGEMAQDDNICRRVVLQENWVVVTVDYRLAPEHIFPAALEDVYVVLRWVEQHIANYGGDLENVIVGGESSGGYLATAVTALHLDMARNDYNNLSFPANSVPFSADFDAHYAKVGPSSLQIKATWFVYPPLEGFTTDNIRLSTIHGMLPARNMDQMWKMYAGSSSTLETLLQIGDYRFAPVFMPQELLAQFPPSVWVIAKHDVLATEGLSFAKRLQEQGRSIQVLMYPRSIHIFFGRWPFAEGLKALYDGINHVRAFIL